MRKKVLLGCTLLLLVAIIAGGTAAYLNQGEKTTNVITMGKVSIQLNDKTKVGDTLTEFPAEGITVAPGVSIEKQVTVTNLDAKAWIRVQPEIAVDKNGQAMPNTLPDTTPVCGLDLDSSKWVDGQDGYFYYTEAVENQGITDNLFKSVTFSPKINNDYQGCTVNIKLNAEAVQYKNNEAGGDVTKVAGWPDVTNQD